MKKRGNPFTNNNKALIIALSIIVSVMLIALIPSSKPCKFNIQFSLENGIIVNFSTEDEINAVSDQR